MEIRRGIIRAFNSGTYLADVQIVGSVATVLTGVPVAKEIRADFSLLGPNVGFSFSMKRTLRMAASLLSMMALPFTPVPVSLTRLTRVSPTPRSRPLPSIANGLTRIISTIQLPTTAGSPARRRGSTRSPLRCGGKATRRGTGTSGSNSMGPRSSARFVRERTDWICK